MFMRSWLAMGCVLVCAATVSAAPGVTAEDLARHGVHEVTLTAERDYANPFQDVHDVAVTFISPGGKMSRVHAFWDGGRTWKARIAVSERGEWNWVSPPSRHGDQGLHGHSGSFQHDGKPAAGPIRVAEAGTFFVTSGGKPFLWLADTAWNGALRSTDEQWKKYLETRREQKFTAIQFVTTQWRGGNEVLDHHAFKGTEKITIDPVFFQRLDGKVLAIVDHGLKPAPIMLWALTPTDPGQALAEADAMRLARYEVARWGAFYPVWMLGGDGRYTKENAPRWKLIGHGTFNGHPEQLVTMHPSGTNWVADLFADQRWFDFIGYQSGHGDGESQLKWNTTGPPAQEWKKHANRPIINLEPNYEGHIAYQSKQPHPAHHVRRAAYWSMLVHPPAGVTYGNNEIWVWNQESGPAENHKNIGIIRPWHKGLKQEGLEDVTVMRTFFESGPWHDLRPAQQLLAEQPGEKDAAKFVAVAQTADRGWTVAYLPVGGSVKLNTSGGANAVWFDPRNGERRAIGRTKPGEQTFAAPDERDWVLSIR